MALPPAWVDFVFAKLAIRYGTGFARQYEGLDPAVVKADWAEALDGISTDTLTHALENLPADRPPNVMQFRALCRTAQAPSRERMALPAPPGEPPDPERVARLIGRLKSRLVDGRSPATRCAAYLRELEAQHGGLTERQAEVLAACESLTGRPG